MLFNLSLHQKILRFSNIFTNYKGFPTHFKENSSHYASYKGSLEQLNSATIGGKWILYME